MTSGGMASFPGAYLPLVGESIALPRYSCVGSVSSFVIPGRLSMVSSASLVIVFSVEYSSTLCSTHRSICLLESVMTSPDFVFSGAVFFMVGSVAFLIPSFPYFLCQTMSGCPGRAVANGCLHNDEQFVGLRSFLLLAQSCSFRLIWISLDGDGSRSLGINERFQFRTALFGLIQ